MATQDKAGTVGLEELLVSTLAQTDALCKLLIEKKLITRAEFIARLSEEKERYQALLKQL